VDESAWPSALRALDASLELQPSASPIEIPTAESKLGAPLPSDLRDCITLSGEPGIFQWSPIDQQARLLARRPPDVLDQPAVRRDHHLTGYSM
jgi:hypothetical protein